MIISLFKKIENTAITSALALYLRERIFAYKIKTRATAHSVEIFIQRQAVMPIVCHTY